MKRKVIGVAFLVAIATAASWSLKDNNQQNLVKDLVTSNTEAMALNAECPNGCLDVKGKCHCYEDYNYKEAEWN